MFKSNKYLNIYFSLVEKRIKNPFCGNLKEIHHIIPKSLGGKNTHDNLVTFSAREHYIAHRILVKITEGDRRIKMVHALWGMSNRLINNKEHEYLTSRKYEEARKLFIEIAGSHLKGRSYEEIYGKEKAITLKKQRANSVSKHRKGKTWEEIFGEEKAQWMRSKVSTGSEKRKGKKQTKETRDKISNSSIGKIYSKVICPHCSRSVGSNNIKRHISLHS